MLPDRVSNPGPLTYESGALPIALRGPAAVHVHNRSVSIMTQKLTEWNKTCSDAILKALSRIMNENRRNKVFTKIKQLTCESTVKTLTSH